MMLNLRIHRPTLGPGFGSGDCRYILDWMEQFSKTLINLFPNTTEEVYVHTIVDGARYNGKNKLLSSPRYDNNPNSDLIEIPDCCFIVEDTVTKDFVVFTADERHHAITCHYMFNEHCKAIYRSHYAPSQIRWIDNDKRHLIHPAFDGGHCVKPWLYPHFQSLNNNVFDTDSFFVDVQEQRKTSDKDVLFAFGGSRFSTSRRTMVDLDSICQDFTLIQGVSYRNYLSQYLPRIRVGAAHWGDWNYMSEDLETRNPRQQGEWCYRDMEYLASGIPFVGQEYEDSLWGGSFVPNFHYIAAPIGKVKDGYKKNGTMGVAEVYKATYDKVKNDTEFLEFISANQIKLWKEWFSAEASIRKTIDIVKQIFQAGK